LVEADMAGHEVETGAAFDGLASIVHDSGRLSGCP
jgi:hypothetical protein